MKLIPLTSCLLKLIPLAPCLLLSCPQNLKRRQIEKRAASAQPADRSSGPGDGYDFPMPAASSLLASPTSAKARGSSVRRKGEPML